MAMGKFFKGLAASGAWACFDEFNRIELEVLSVIAQQILTIQRAIIMGVAEFEFDGKMIKKGNNFGVFITMNPGYAGRTELPENLKVLFRSCAMIRPDLAPICENMLMAEGFVDARPLSVKFVTLYELSSDLLSPQIHYDWGLRSVKSVLRVAGSLKRQSPEQNEEPVLMRALRDFNTPKQPNSDMPIFLRLIQDLFPLLSLIHI